MTMTATHPAHGHPRKRRRGKRLFALPLILLVTVAIFSASFVTYVLWPRWPANPVALDAPTLPVTVAGVTFNVPPAAIRQRVQRRPGVQDRIDLAFVWPSLEAPDPKLTANPAAAADAINRIFVTIAASNTALSPAERVKTIYPRYLESAIHSGRDGLMIHPFRDDTPYQGEELVYDGRAFLARCSRNSSAGTLGMCLYDLRIGGADLTARFPRDWLDDWRGVAEGLNKLILSLRAHGG